MPLAPLPAVVVNGVPLVMTLGGSPSASRIVVPTVTALVSANGFPLALAGFTMSGVPCTFAPFSLCLWNGLPCAMLGSVVTCTDGYVGVFDLTHTAGASFLIT